MSDPKMAAGHLAVSEEMLADAYATSLAMTAYLTATPQQRAEWERQAVERRAAERAAAVPVELSLPALLDKLDFTDPYARHLVQPYCTCGDSYDGWDYCQHARDEGLVP